ncbi:acetyltransferase [Staphylococcus epidermidis 36-1]|nr:acetyltransferase [Staphylococcus epidermidis 36-1]
MIRKAKTSDNRQIAELCYLIWRDMELDITKEITKDRIIEAIELSIVNVRYRSFYEHIWVYEKDGVVAGCVIAYPGKEEMDFEQQWLKLPLEEDILQLGTPLPEKESYDDEIYIEAVVTTPKYRGQGIANTTFKVCNFHFMHMKNGD